MPDPLDPAAFAAASRRLPVLDVRSPSEYAQGHVPGAHSLPLFGDEERAEIGTLYRHEGRHAALLRGLDLVGPKMRSLVERAGAVAGRGEVLLYCWRGGMRSESTTWLLKTAGLRPRRLAGGYKAFRQWVLDRFEQPVEARILSGRTGAGKTEVLHALARHGAQTVDLEALAYHRGSVFGGFGQPAPPTQQGFENALALALEALDPARPVWFEDESRRIGSVNVPNALWRRMRTAPVYVLDVPTETRVARLVDEYGTFPTERLQEAVCKVRRRLGGLRTREALAALDAGDRPTACRLLLHYYDRAYDHGLSRRASARLHHLAPDTHDPARIARALLDAAGADDGH